MRYKIKQTNKKTLNRVTARDKGAQSLTNKSYATTISEAKQNPEFIKEINRFIKATTKVYRLE